MLLASLSNCKIGNRDQTGATMLNSIPMKKLDVICQKLLLKICFHISIPYYVVVNQNAFKKADDELEINQIYGE